MNYSAYTNVGGRKNNEDSFETVSSCGCSLFVLADGLGGLEAGEKASAAATGEIRDQFLFDPKGFELKQAVEASNELVLSLQRESGKNMKTTVAAVYVADGTVYCSHVGDSRIYLFNEDTICYQSIDHSASQLAVFAGEISADGIRTHSDRNVLTRALGASEGLSVEVKSFPAESLRAVLICSDGFWEYVYEDEMLALLKAQTDAEAWINDMRGLLSQRVKENNDNNTAVAVIF